MSVLQVGELSVTDRGGTVISSVPGFTVEVGDAVALVGESGSGKSTVLLAIQDLLATGLTANGAITFDGIPIGATAEEKLPYQGSHVGLVLQSPHGALPPTTRLGRTAELTLALHDVPAAERADRLREAFQSVRLSEELLRRYPHQVSGGQAQRFSIALLLALQTPFILADEPTSALDLTVQAEIIELLNGLLAAKRIGLVIVSHDLPLVGQLAREILVLQGGQTVDRGTVREVFLESTAAYTRSLIEAVPKLPVSRSSLHPELAEEMA